MTEHSTEPPRRTVAIIDDHEMLRTGVRAEIEQHVDAVGEAGDVDSALELLGREQPDVVLLDVHMPGGGGNEVIRRHRSASSKFLALSVSDAAEDVIGVIRAGAQIGRASCREGVTVTEVGDADNE